MTNIKKFIIVDPTNMFFWVKNIHYGYNLYGDNIVFDTRFTNELSKASMFDSKEEAKNVLDRFATTEFVQSGQFKIVRTDLMIKELNLTLEIVDGH